MSKNQIDPATLLQRIEKLLENTKGTKITFLRGLKPVFRAKVKQVERFSGTLTFTTTGTEMHIVLAGQTLWQQTGQKGETRTAVRLGEYTVHKAEANRVHLTKPDPRRGFDSSYLVEPITD